MKFHFTLALALGLSQALPLQQTAKDGYDGVLPILAASPCAEPASKAPLKENEYKEPPKPSPSPAKLNDEDCNETPTPSTDKAPLQEKSPNPKKAPLKEEDCDDENDNKQPASPTPAAKVTLKEDEDCEDEVKKNPVKEDDEDCEDEVKKNPVKEDDCEDDYKVATPLPSIASSSTTSSTTTATSTTKATSTTTATPSATAAAAASAPPPPTYDYSGYIVPEPNSNQIVASIAVPVEFNALLAAVTGGLLAFILI